MEELKEYLTNNPQNTTVWVSEDENKKMVWSFTPREGWDEKTAEEILKSKTK
jgi:hypothetical protein